MKVNRNNKQQATISKGYRLKPSTHKKIKVLGKSLRLRQDDLIGKALGLLMKNMNKIKG